MASEWQGGDNFVKIKRGSNGRMGGTGDGSRRKKWGAAGTRKKCRFNANPTRSNGPNCQIHAQAQRDKKAHVTAPRVVKIIPSGFKVA